MTHRQIAGAIVLLLLFALVVWLLALVIGFWLAGAVLAAVTGFAAMLKWALESVSGDRR